MLPYSRQDVDDDDIKAVLDALRSDRITQGPAVTGFEEAVATEVGAPFAVAFSSGTAGLHAAAAVAGVGPGHIVGTPSLTFVASANCARYVGAEVRFLDIDEATLGVDPEAVTADLDALVAVHFAGRAVDLSCLPHRPRVVIEDAAHALGATGAGGPVGSCRDSDMCVFSFHPVKSITSAEGGMVTTRSPELADRLRRFRHHGITIPEGREPWEHEISEVGFNYRLSDVHAALGRQQLTRLASFVTRRNALADRYDELLADLPVGTPPRAAPAHRHARHLYPVRVRDRAEVFRRLRDDGIGVQVHYVPIHTQPLYAAARRPLPVTEEVAAELISLPLFPTMSTQEQDRVVDSLTRALRAA